MITVTVRYFAGARAAAGTEGETVFVPAGSGVADVLEAIRRQHDQELGKVLAACSFLLDGMAVRDQMASIADGTQLDVLPPFAGG